MFVAAGVLIVAVAGAAPAPARPEAHADAAQGTAGTATAAAATLGKGWTALASGRPQEALAEARQLLRLDPGNHDALALAVAALVARQQSSAALDAYEQWLAASRREDLFPLQSIARSVLATLSAHAQPRVRNAALIARAETGDAEARETLVREAQADSSVEVDAALAASGDQAAVGRLEAQVSAPGRRDTSAAIRALAETKSAGAARAIMAALKTGVPPSRIAAAAALADLGATEAIPALKEALSDGEPAVRGMVTLALARLGDPTGGTALRDLATSPVADFRLLAARLAAEQNPQGNWTSLAESLLQDADPLVRLQAAGLLLKYGRSEGIQPAIQAALGDPAPFVRTQAARILSDRLTATDPNLPDLRRLLRDPLPEVQIAAARALLLGQVARMP